MSTQVDTCDSNQLFSHHFTFVSCVARVRQHVQWLSSLSMPSLVYILATPVQRFWTSQITEAAPHMSVFPHKGIACASLWLPANCMVQTMHLQCLRSLLVCFPAIPLSPRSSCPRMYNANEPDVVSKHWQRPSHMLNKATGSFSRPELCKM